MLSALHGQASQIDSKRKFEVEQYDTPSRNYLRTKHSPTLPPIEINDTLERIIECESGWNLDAKNPNSSAQGLCQIIQSTEDQIESDFGYEINFDSRRSQLRACKHLYEKRGCKPWAASSNCHQCY